MSFSARSHACDRRKRSPPFLLRDGCSTLSQRERGREWSSHLLTRKGDYVFFCHMRGTGHWRTSLAVYHMTSQPVHKPDEVRRFWTQRRNVLNVSPVFDLFFQSTYCFNWMNNLHQDIRKYFLHNSFHCIGPTAFLSPYFQIRELETLIKQNLHDFLEHILHLAISYSSSH